MAASQPAAPAGRRRRPRRGSLERPVSGRIYRAAWVLVALPLLVAAFTVGRPNPLPRPPLPPSFDGETAAQLARELSRTYPDRSPGSDDALAAARWVAERLAAYNMNVAAQSFQADVPGLGSVTMT